MYHQHMVKVWFALVSLLGATYLLLGAMLLMPAFLLLLLFTSITGIPVQLLTRRGISCYMRLFCRIVHSLGMVCYDREELTPLRDVGSPVIIAPTHPSLLDAIFIIAYTPATGCIMKSSLLRNPLISIGSRIAGFVPNAPAIRMLRQGRDELRAGGQLLVFPEGTRSETHQKLNPFLPAAAALAAASGSPILPVLISSDYPYMAKGSHLWTLPDKPVHFRFSLLPKISPQQMEDTNHFNTRIEKLYTEAHHAFLQNGSK